MKLMSFTVGTSIQSYGVVVDNGVIDLGRRTAGSTTLRQFLAHGHLDRARDLAASEGPDHGLDEVSFLPVIGDPDKIICVGLNYRDHVAEVGRTVTEKPALFARFAGSQVGHLQPMIKPTVSDEFDYEGEIAVIIGKAGRHIAAKDALSHIAGYACYNEGTIRDWQRHTSQYLAGKTFAGTGAFGPWMVTCDEVPDPSGLTLETRLNGQVVQHAKADQLITAIPDLITYCSTILTLLPGDVIVTGTPGGVGAKRVPPLFMKAGDVVEVEVSGVGVLRNTIAAE